MASKITEASKELLVLLSDDELFTLSGTVTRGLLRNKLNSREEAINAIIKYSTDESSILRRKIITRELLFRYLHEKNVPVALPKTKPELIDIILNYWGVKEQNNQENTEEVGAAIEIVRENSIEVLALKFTEWFYSMMNENVPIGEEHFWADGKLKLNLISNAMNINKEVESSPSDIANLLFETKTEHNLFFNPNLTPSGTQGRMDPHGLVIVMSCGTLHAGQVCAGVYEQVFAIARDPLCDNNWKVKSSELNLRSSEVSSQPCLENSALTRNLLALPSE